MTPSLRAAQAPDAAFLARVILAAGRSHVATSFWDLLLDRPGDAAVCAYLERLVLAPRRSWWHYRNFLVAESDGEPAAALSGFAPVDPEIEAPEPAVVRALGGQGMTPASVETAIRRASPFFTCTQTPTTGAWVVENVATRPEHRRRGHVAALLPRILEEGRDRGYEIAQLTIFIGNDPARRAYEQAGFRVASEKRHPEFEAAIGCPGLARMECPL